MEKPFLPFHFTLFFFFFFCDRMIFWALFFCMFIQGLYSQATAHSWELASATNKVPFPKKRVL